MTEDSRTGKACTEEDLIVISRKTTVPKAKEALFLHER
jgi:hypothetical protein